MLVSYWLPAIAARFPIGLKSRLCSSTSNPAFLLATSHGSGASYWLTLSRRPLSRGLAFYWLLAMGVGLPIDIEAPPMAPCRASYWLSDKGAGLRIDRLLRPRPTLVDIEAPPLFQMLVSYWLPAIAARFPIGLKSRPCSPTSNPGFLLATSHGSGASYWLTSSPRPLP